MGAAVIPSQVLSAGKADKLGKTFTNSKKQRYSLYLHCALNSFVLISILTLDFLKFCWLKVSFTQ